MKRIVAREEVCIGCRLCEVHCLAEHAPSKDIVKAYKRERSLTSSRVRVEEEGALSFALQCRQCDDPACAAACLTGALQVDEETGRVTYNPEQCMGCWTCVLVCPHGVPQRDPSGTRVMPRCDMCVGRGTPACVENCPNEALILVEDAS
jgi:anaerobic carbon-monoxide dehydrogenase iron sulfur subunit